MHIFVIWVISTIITCKFKWDVQKDTPISIKMIIEKIYGLDWIRYMFQDVVAENDVKFTVYHTV